MNARMLLALIPLILPLLLTGCAPSPPVPLDDMRELWIPVRNNSPRFIPLAVVSFDALQITVGTAQPDTIPPGTELLVRFLVPAGADWTILANGGTTIGSADVRNRVPGRSHLVIEIDTEGEQRWSCSGDCP